MYKARIHLEVDRRIEARCPDHRNYHPREGQGGIKRSCPTCIAMLNAYEALIKVEEAIEIFYRKTEQFAIVKKARARKTDQHAEAAAGR